MIVACFLGLATGGSIGLLRNWDANLLATFHSLGEVNGCADENGDGGGERLLGLANGCQRCCGGRSENKDDRREWVKRDATCRIALCGEKD